MQVLLVDGSTFTVGPGSDLVIDKFVYDPKKQTGEVVASFSKGVMRFVGGKISKNDEGVTVNTPAGALAIRGGMFQGSVNGGKGVFSFLYGVNMTLTGKNGQSYTVFQPGNTIDTTGTAPTIRPTTSADVNTIMAALTNGNTNGTGTPNGGTGTGPQPGSKYTAVETLSLQDLISDANTDQIQGALDKQESKPPTDMTNPPPTDTTNPPPTDTTTNPPPPPPPLPVTARVLTAPGTSTGDDFTGPFSLQNGRLTGTVSVTNPLNVDFPATLQCVNGVCPITVNDHATVTQSGQTTTYEGLAVLKKDFFAYHVVGVPQGPSISTNALDINNGPSADPLLVFGGKGYDFGTPAGKTYVFVLTPDVVQVQGGAFGPFASAQSSPEVDPNKPPPSISPLLYLEKDSASVNDPSRAVWLQTSLYINTTPANSEAPISFDQQSFVNVALGDVANGGLVGARRGGANVDFAANVCGEGGCSTSTSRETLAFTGDVATLAGPDGSHFLGSDTPNVVIGADSTVSHNLFRDQPLNPIAGVNDTPQNQSGATYHVGVGLGILQPQPQTYAGKFEGYAAGIYGQPLPGQAEVRSGLNGTGSSVGVLTSGSPGDFSITFDPQQNTLSASLTVAEADPDGEPGDPHDSYGGVTLGFGDTGFGDTGAAVHGRSAFIDNLHYAAIETPGTTTVSVLKYGDELPATPSSSASSTAYLVSGDQLNVMSFFPDTFPETSHGSGVRPFCTSCDFLKWGAWGTRTDFADPNNGNATSTVDVHLGWWVAGDLTSPTDITALGIQHATATYEGHVLGDVAKLTGTQWQTYVAAGDLAMSWDFAARKGDLTISNFDGRSYSTNPYGNTPNQLTQPSLDFNKFGGSLSQTAGPTIDTMTGGVTGSFANNIVNGQIIKAGGVLGNWNVGSDAYRAAGIFAGSATSGPR